MDVGKCDELIFAPDLLRPRGAASITDEVVAAHSKGSCRFGKDRYGMYVMQVAFLRSLGYSNDEIDKLLSEEEKSP